MSSTLRLVSMNSERLEAFIRIQETKYADSLFKAGSFESMPEALERSRAQLKTILANPREEQNFCGVCVGDEEVGVLWWAMRQPDSALWIYDIEIHEHARRKGYAREALLRLEEWAKRHQAPSIGLNVFAYNVGAEKLYREMGYEDTSKQMRKSLK